MTLDGLIMTGAGIGTFLWVSAALIRKAYTGTETCEPRHRCEARLSHGTCSRPGNRIEHVGGVHYLCTRHASDEGWGR